MLTQFRIPLGLQFAALLLRQRGFLARVEVRSAVPAVESLPVEQRRRLLRRQEKKEGGNHDA